MIRIFYYFLLIKVIYDKENQEKFWKKTEEIVVVKFNNMI